MKAHHLDCNVDIYRVTTRAVVNNRLRRERRTVDIDGAGAEWVFQSKILEEEGISRKVVAPQPRRTRMGRSGAGPEYARDRLLIVNTMVRGVREKVKSWSVILIAGLCSATGMI